MLCGAPTGKVATIGRVNPGFAWNIRYMNINMKCLRGRDLSA